MRRHAWLAILATTLVALAGCSVSGFAVDKVGDALAAGGSTFGSDDDPQFVAQAAPFSLKLMESLLAERPQHRGLLQATAAGFTQYGYAFLQLPADELEPSDLERAEDLRSRARRMFVRAHGYGLRGLEVAQPGFRSMLAHDPAAAAAMTNKADVGLLYWTAASLAAAIGVSKDDPARVGDLPKVQALIDRALQLDDSFDGGAIHSFLVGFTMARPDLDGPRVALARQHFERALELAHGQDAGTHVSWAEAVCMSEDDRECFESELRAALEVDADAFPERRLSNLVMQRRAAWLMTQADRRFLPAMPDPATANGVTK